MIINKTSNPAYFLKNSRYQLILFLLFCTATLTLIFSPFLFGNQVFVFLDVQSDTYTSYLPQYEMICQKIALGEFSFMDFSFGLGTSIFAASFFSDPFSIIPIATGLLWGTEYLAYGLVYMQMCKILIAALLCCLYLKEFNFSSISTYCVAFLYACSGYAFGAGQHYQFMTLPVLLMLVLLFTEKTLKNRKFTFTLILSITFICVMSSYFAFLVLLFYGIYVAIRLLQLSSINKLVTYVVNLLYFAFIGILGILIAGIIFLPSLYQIVGVSARITEDTTLLQGIIHSIRPLNFQQLKLSALRLFSENIYGTTNHFIGMGNTFEAPHYFMSVFLILALPQYIVHHILYPATKKTRVITILIACMVGICMTTYVAGSLANMFSAFNFRYSIVLLPIFAIVMATTLDNIVYHNIFYPKINVLTTLGSIALILYFIRALPDTDIKLVAFLCISFLLVVSVCLYVLSRKNGIFTSYKPMVLIIFLLALVLNVSIDHFITLQYDRDILTKTDLHDVVHNEDITSALDFIKDSEGDNMYRIERTTIDQGVSPFYHSLIGRYRSCSTYNSVLNGNTIEYAQNYGHTEHLPFILQSYAWSTFGPYFNNVMADTLGIKYLISDTIYDVKGWELTHTDNDYYVYQNTDLQSMGLLYDKYMIQSDYEKLSHTEQVLTLSNCIIIDDEQQPTLELYEPTFVANTIPISAEEDATSFAFPDEFLVETDLQTILTFNILTSENISFYLYFDLGEGYEDSASWYNTLSCKANQLTSLSVDLPNSAIGMKFVFPDNATAELSDIVINTSEIDYTNNGVSFINEDLGDTVSGTVDTETDKLLYMAIPYENGWAAYLDGVETPILRANFGFSAIQVPAGSHNVDLIYTPPWLLLGCFTTIIGLIAFIILLYLIYIYSIDYRYLLPPTDR